MKKSDKQEQRINKFTEVKTFSVPFTFGEIKEDISISTNTPSKPSKEQIINQACKFHSQGNIPEAAKDNKEGFCEGGRSWEFPLTYSFKTGLKRSLFSTNLKRGFNWSIIIEREEFSYLSISKDKSDVEIQANDGAKLIAAMKSAYLWLTAGLGYNFSIWKILIF